MVLVKLEPVLVVTSMIFTHRLPIAHATTGITILERIAQFVPQGVLIVQVQVSAKVVSRNTSCREQCVTLANSLAVNVLTQHSAQHAMMLT